MLKNQHIPGGPFDELLTFLGDRVTLKGFDRFLGGLDPNNDLTGKESVYTEFEGNEIMFHVSTLLPYSNNDHQQVSCPSNVTNVGIKLIEHCNIGTSAHSSCVCVCITDTIEQ